MNGDLKVVHVVLTLDVGGLERIIVDLVRRGRALGQSVAVVCLERRGVLAVEVEALGARVVCLDKEPGIHWAIRKRLRRVFDELRPDVIHTHQVGALFYAGPVARKLGIPVVVHTEHGNHLRTNGSKFIRRQRKCWLSWWAARSTSRFFCVSSNIAEEMTTRRIVPPRKLAVLFNGIDTEPFLKPVDRAAVRESLGIPPEAPVLGTVGRLSEIKRQDLLIEGFAKLLRKRPDAHLVLVGDGPMRGELEALTEKLKLCDRVHFAGYQSAPERSLAAMDVFVLSSRMEGLPLSILEAWAAGRPVVASAVGGVKDLIEHGRTGLLFPSGDELQLVDRMNELLGDASYAKELGNAGRNEVLTRYDLGRMAGDYNRHYRELLDQLHPVA